MVDLVINRKDETFCDSTLVAKKFKQKHNKVVNIIENLILRINNIEDLRGSFATPKIIKEERNYRGRDYTAYLMNRSFFSLLAMRFNSEEALKWQIKFNDAFYVMEDRFLKEKLNKQDSAWLECRNSGKQIRQDTTDIIKEFVEYATEQGSKSAKFYYKHVTNATYKALGMLQQKKPKLRDTLNHLELGFLQSAEYVAQQSIKKHMAEGYPYKLIYKHVCSDLEKFAESLLITKGEHK